MKIESVLTYGYSDVVSGFAAKTLNVQQHPSVFSTLNTELVVSVSLLLTGILQGVPFPLQVYNIIGRVLHITQLVPPPKAGLSQDSKQLSGQAYPSFAKKQSWQLICVTSTT